MIKTTADGIRFLLEIATVVLLIIAGFNSSDLVVKLTVGVIAPVLGILFWGRFMAPMSLHRLPTIGRVITEIPIFGGTSLATYLLTTHKTALIYGGIALIDTLIEHLIP